MIHLHVHSDHSIFDGYSKIDEIVSRTTELGANAVALTDHGTMSGTITFYKACNKANIKPILGIEAYFVPEAKEKDRGNFHLILLAKNNTGYRNLLKLDTLAHENYYYKPRIDLSMVEQYHEGIIALSACMGSILNTDDADYWTEIYKRIFGNDFYLEIQPNRLTGQAEYNHKIIGLSKKYNIPLVVTTDAHYSRLEDAKYHRLWVNINKDENNYYPTDDFYLKSEQEVLGVLVSQGIDLSIAEEAVKNTHVIADQCEVRIEVEGNHYPIYPTDDAVEEVKRICRTGWFEKIANTVPKEQHQVYIDRFNHELPLLERCNYLNYLLITQDILNWCRANDIMTGPGRGSSGGSLVAYLMNITKVDPIKHGLLFERFVNPDRVTPPDIDNDVSKIRRQEVIEYIRQKYGHVYNVRTFNYLGAKGALQRAGQALRLEPRAVIQLSKKIESLDQVSGNDELVDVARHFEERLHAFGCHASAVLVFPDEPTAYCPIEKQGDTFLTAYEHHALEELGLLKIDLLGLATLDVIQETTRMLPNDIDVFNLPLDDASVYSLFSTGMTSGLFQTESNGMRYFAKQMKVDRFEDIVALVALYRPGPLDSGMAQQYIDGKNGAEIKYLHPDLEPILQSTYSVIVYQEQVMAIVKKMAAMTPGEADNFRKVIGRKELDKIEAIVNEFVERSVANGYSREVAEEVGRQIQACGRYIFNLSHATEYGDVSYITAYLKTHYPLEYMTALLNNEMGDLEKTADYIKEAKRIGIKILPPDIRYSKPKHTIENGCIRYGTNAIKGVGSTEFIPANSFDEFISVNKVDNGTLEALIKAGAFPGETRGVLLAKLAWLKDKNGGKRVEQCKQKIAEYTAKANPKKVTEWEYHLKNVAPFDGKPIPVDDPLLEREVLGFHLTTSPFDNYMDVLSINTLSWSEFLEAGVNSEVIIGGQVKKIKKHTDKRGKEMAFIGIQAVDGDLVDVTVFASDWEREKERGMYEGAIVRVKGKKNDENKMIGNIFHLVA